jgi:hypothetical protein
VAGAASLIERLAVGPAAGVPSAWAMLVLGCAYLTLRRSATPEPASVVFAVLALFGLDVVATTVVAVARDSEQRQDRDEQRGKEPAGNVHEILPDSGGGSRTRSESSESPGRLPIRPRQ